MIDITLQQYKSIFFYNFYQENVQPSISRYLNEERKRVKIKYISSI